MSTETTSGKKGPTHRVLQIEDRGEHNKAYWREVGVGFTNTDGSINLSFAVIPMIGKHTIQLRIFDEKKKDESQGTPEPAKSSRSRRGK